MRGLTSRQGEVLGFIKGFHAAFGYMPTYREIGEHFGFSDRRAYECVAVMVKKGYLRRERLRPRRIHFVLELKIAACDIPGVAIEKGDYVHVYGGVVRGITRSFEEVGVGSGVSSGGELCVAGLG